MKTKTRLFLCLATLLILISLTSCSGLLASKNTASGKGRITIELGGARAATGPEVEGYLIYLVPTTKNRSSYENYMMAMMATTAGTMDIHNLPEGAILYTGNDSSKSYEVETGYWYILVTAFVDLGYEESVEFYGYTTTLVSENQTSNVTLDMTQNLDFSENYAPNFEDTLYFVAVKDTYYDVDKATWQGEPGENPLIFMPDMSILPEINFNPEESEEEEMVGLLLASMFAGDGSSYKLSNIQPRNNKLYADIIKVSYTDASDSTFLSNVQIKHVTEFGVQLEAGATDYFLFTSEGMEDYMVWFSLGTIYKYMETQLSTIYGAQLSEEELAELQDSEPDPIEAFIILPEPESVSEIEEQINIFNNRNSGNTHTHIIQ